MSGGVGGRRGSDLVLLWLRCRPSAIAPTGPLAWEPQYASGATLKRSKKKKKTLFFLTNSDMPGTKLYSGKKRKRTSKFIKTVINFIKLDIITHTGPLHEHKYFICF